MFKSEHTAHLALAAAKPTSTWDKVGKNFAAPIPRLQRETQKKSFVAMGNKYK